METGTRVEWTETKRSGRGYSMSQKYGSVVSVEGEVATVKRRNGRVLNIHVSRLHICGQGPNQLTQFVRKLAGH